MAGRRGVTVWLALLLAGCANYDERLAEAHEAYYSEDLTGAVALLEEQLADAEGDNDELILKLEYALALQASGRFDEASAIMSEVDDAFEVLDYTSAGIEDVVAFAFAPEAAVYQTSPPERVMINTQAMITRLADGDVQGASVEARKMRTLVTMADVPEEELFANRFAWALAGFSLAWAGDLAEAQGAWRESGDTPFQDDALAAGQTLPSGESSATILVIGQLGQAPIRSEATYYFPIANTIHRLNLPAIVERQSSFDSLGVTLDGTAQGDAEVLFDYGAHVRARYDQELPMLLAAAVTQAIPRAAVSEAAAELTENAYESSNQDDESAEAVADLLGFFVGFLIDWSLAEAAGCDTRAWTMLPDKLAVHRLNVAPGAHQLRFQLRGRNTRAIGVPVPTLAAGDLHVVNLISDVHGTYVPPPSPNGSTIDEDSPMHHEVLQIASTFSALTFDFD